MIILRMESGALCHLDFSRRTAYGCDERIEVSGAEGRVESRHPIPVDVALYRDGVIRQRGLHQHWYERIEDSYPPSSPPSSMPSRVAGDGFPDAGRRSRLRGDRLRPGRAPCARTGRCRSRTNSIELCRSVEGAIRHPTRNSGHVPCRTAVRQSDPRTRVGPAGRAMRSPGPLRERPVDQSIRPRSDMNCTWLSTSAAAAGDLAFHSFQRSLANERNCLRSSVDQSCRVTPAAAMSRAACLVLDLGQ